MKIVILDGYTENPGDLSWSAFEALGETTVYDRTPNDDDVIAARMAGAEVVYTNKTPIRAAVLERCPTVRFIGVLATGYNVVDCAAAKAHGIPVSNIPAYGTEAVAQFAIALLLEICSRVGLHDQAVHAGRWASCPDFCFWEAPMIELSGKTMGIVGLGRIGKAVARIAGALGMHVIACGSRPTDEGRAAAEYVSQAELFARADVISLHCPLTADNAQLINRQTIAQMKDGVILLNNSRGGLVDEAALAEALNAGKILAAGVDVVSTEPIAPDNPLLHAKNCIITPHISWAPFETRARLMDIAAENLRAYCAGHPIHVVNP